MGMFGLHKCHLEIGNQQFSQMIVDIICSAYTHRLCVQFRPFYKDLQAYRYCYGQKCLLLCQNMVQFIKIETQTIKLNEMPDNWGNLKGAWLYFCLVQILKKKIFNIRYSDCMYLTKIYIKSEIYKIRKINNFQMSVKQSQKRTISQLYQVGDFIDARDNQGDWRVGYIVDKSDVSKMFKIRFDGWATKYDQFYRFGHPKLKQFRSIALGYTGQKQNPALRQSWKFSLAQQQKKLVQLHDHVVKNNQQKIRDAHDFNQWIRGHNYFYVDFLMTLKFSGIQEMHKVVQFFKLNILLGLKYLKSITQNFDDFAQNIKHNDREHLEILPIAKCFAFYEIFDMIYTITGSYQRLKSFFKENQELLRQQFTTGNKDVKTVYQLKMIDFFYKNGGMQSIEQVLRRIREHKGSTSYVFLYSLAHLFSGVSCVLQTKLKQSVARQFKQITDKSVQHLGDKQMKDFNHHQVSEYINQILSFSKGTQVQRDMDSWAQKVQMQLCFKMITCPFFQKKLRGITSLHQFIGQRPQLIADGTLGRWIEDNKLFDVLFSNDNPELIKKSTELIKYLYNKDNQMQKYIQLIWMYRQGKHETALKQIYNFLGEVPIYDKDQQFTVQLFKKHLALVDQVQWDPEYIKMIKDYTVNALLAWTGKQTFGFQIIYRYSQKNQGDETLIKYLTQILDKLKRTQFVHKFITDCSICIQKQINCHFHISLLLKVLREKIVDMRVIKIDLRAIVQQNIVLSKNQESENLQVRFQLLNQILKQAKQIIPEQDFIAFWKQMVHSGGRIHFFKWLYKARESGKVVLTVFINMQTKQYLLQNFWTEEYLQQNKQLDEDEGIFLLELFKAVNAKEGKIRRTNAMLEVLDQNLVGIQKLHSTYRMCIDQKAAQVLAKGLVQIYLSGGEDLPELNTRLINIFIERITKEIKHFLQTNELNAIKRTIRLIQQMILRDQEVYHVKPNIAQESVKNFVVKNGVNNEEKTIRFDVGQSIYSLKKHIAERFVIPVYKFDLWISQGQTISPQNYSRSVGQVGIKGKIVLKPRSNVTSKIKNILNHQLQLLFQLLGNKQIQGRVWNIVAKLPISTQIQQKILNSQNPLQILENSSFYKQLYLFKVALSLDKKWWNLGAQQMVSFFLSRLQKTAASSQIERQYLMVSAKLLEGIIRSDEISDPELFSRTFTSFFRIVKRILVQTNQVPSFNLIYLKKIIETFFSISELFNKFLQKKQLKATQPDALSLMLQDQKVEDLLRLCLMEYKEESIRKQFPVRLGKLANVSKQKNCNKLADIILNSLLDFSVECGSKSLKQFNAFSCFILQTMSGYLQGFYAQNKSYFFNKLFKLIQGQQSEVNSETTNYSLVCYMSLIRYVTQEVPRNEIQRFFSYIYNECLFNGNESKCKSKQTRTAVFNLFQRLIKHQKNQEMIVSTFGNLHQNGLWRSRKLEDWTITHSQRLKSPTGYTGLRNLGCICYMNSFLQQIFMIEEFRLALLLAQDPNYDPKTVDDNVLYQVKRMFMNLMYSDKKAYNPKPFCLSFKDYEGNPTNVSEQMDIDQFSGILFDRLQTSLRGTRHFNLIKETFGGVFSNQIICKGCPHFSQSQESFLSLSLTVKDKRSVYESLQTMIKGDTLDGDNAYHCQRCDKKVSAVKRVCLKHLPDFLIVTLKRFQFDFSTMTKLKLNEYCEFPREINLEEYSYQYLRKRQNPKAFEGEQLNSKEYYQYRLKGVVIHLGYADSGHYYSLIQGKNQEEWLQFNDTIVRSFMAQNLNEQAFGGETGGPQSKQKIKNAYMLIYERVYKVNPIREEVMRLQSSIKGMGMYKQALQTINQQNSEHNIENILFSAQYFRFVNMLIQEAGRSKHNSQLQKFVILAFLTTSIRSKPEPGMLETLQKIHNNFGHENPQLAQWLLSQFCDYKIFDELFRNCPIRDIKRHLASWALQMLRDTNDINSNINFLKTITLKITTQNENNVQALTILHNLADQDYCLEFLISNNIIGRMMENIIRKQPRIFGSVQNLRQTQKEPSYLGYEQIIQKTAFQLKKLKFDNQSSVVWALAYKIMKKYKKSQLQKVLHKKQVEYLYLTREKIYKLLQQVKSKFHIDVVTDYVCYLCFQNQQLSLSVIQMIEKGLKQFQSKRYRQFFVLFGKLIALKDYLADQRITWISYIIRSLKQNQKYAMDCTIIELWLCKIINQNQRLRGYLAKQKDILQYLANLLLKRVPSEQLSKKNSNFGQALVNKLHGIPFPKSRRGYLKILRQVQQFYEKLLKYSYQPMTNFESGDHCVFDKLSIGDKVAYFDLKEKIDYEQVTIKDILFDKICIARKSSPSKTFWVWIDDQKLTSNLRVIKQENQHELDSSKTTEMEDQIDLEAVN